MAAADTDEGDIDLDDAPPAAPPTPTAPASDNGADPAAQFKSRLQALMTQIQQAAAAGAGGAAEARVRAGQAAQLGVKKQFDQAHQLLDQAEQLLRQARAGANGAADPFKDRYRGLLATVPGDLGRLKQQDAAAAGRLAPIVAAAHGHAQKGDYKKAFAFLDQAAVALSKALAGAGGDSGLAAEWKAKLAVWTPAIKVALAVKGANTAALAKLLAQASALSKPGGDMA
jgi:hypothetical protein